jgi:hypothetical protein
MSALHRPVRHGQAGACPSIISSRPSVPHHIIRIAAWRGALLRARFSMVRARSHGPFTRPDRRGAGSARANGSLPLLLCGCPRDLPTGPGAALLLGGASPSLRPIRHCWIADETVSHRSGRESSNAQRSLYCDQMSRSRGWTQARRMGLRGAESAARCVFGPWLGLRAKPCSGF